MQKRSRTSLGNEVAGRIERRPEQQPDERAHQIHIGHLRAIQALPLESRCVWFIGNEVAFAFKLSKIDPFQH